MQMLRFAPGWVVFLVTPLLGGCIIKLGGGGDDIDAPWGDTTSGGDPAVTDAQQARKDEADQYVTQVIYRGAPILQSLELASGDIVDGLDRSAFPTLPYALPALPFQPGEPGRHRLHEPVSAGGRHR